MIRQAAVVLLSSVPFVVSILLAYVSWETFVGIATVWRMVILTLVWIGAFAIGTQLFWKATGLLAQKQQ